MRIWFTVCSAGANAAWFESSPEILPVVLAALALLATQSFCNARGLLKSPTNPYTPNPETKALNPAKMDPAKMDDPYTPSTEPEKAMAWFCARVLQTSSGIATEVAFGLRGMIWAMIWLRVWASRLLATCSWGWNNASFHFSVHFSFPFDSSLLGAFSIKAPWTART